MPSDPQLKGLPVAPEVVLFRVIDSVVRADPVVKSVVKTFRSWQGKPDDKNPLAIGDAPSLRMTPHGSAEEPWSLETQIGWLYVDFELMTRGYCSDDIVNLWYAVKRALNPNDRTAKDKLVTRLQQAGAHKGLIQFSQPAFDRAGGGDGLFTATAQCKVEYRVNFYS